MSEAGGRPPAGSGASGHTTRIEADSDVRLDSFVARWLDLSRTQAATLIANGKVTVGGRRERASYRPVAGDAARTLALGLVCGGAIGNLVDRVRSPLGVVDFIDVGIGDMRWPTFNVADMAVSVGAFLLAWVLWGEDRETAAAHRRTAPTPAPAGSAPSGRDPRDLS